MSLTDQKVSDYTLRLRIVVTLLPSFIHLSTLIPWRYLFFLELLYYYSRMGPIGLREMHLYTVFIGSLSFAPTPAANFLWMDTYGLLELFVLWFQSKSLCLKVFISVMLVYAIGIPSAEIRIVFRCRNQFHCQINFWSSIFINLNNIFGQYRQFHKIGKT